MGALDPTGVGAMMVGIDAADASVSAALEAMAPAAAYAAWQLKNTRVGPARDDPERPNECVRSDRTIRRRRWRRTTTWRRRWTTRWRSAGRRYARVAAR